MSVRGNLIEQGVFRDDLDLKISVGWFWITPCICTPQVAYLSGGFILVKWLPHVVP